MLIVYSRMYLDGSKILGRRRQRRGVMQMLQIRAGCAAAPVGEEDAVTAEDYGSQFLNESGEGVEEEEICREEEVPLKNSGEVY